MDFGRHLALRAVETHGEGRWVIHLEAGLLRRTDTRTVNVHNAQCTVHGAQCTVHGAQCTAHHRRSTSSGWQSTDSAEDGSCTSTSSISTRSYLTELRLVRLQRTEANNQTTTH